MPKTMDLKIENYGMINLDSKNYAGLNQEVRNYGSMDENVNDVSYCWSIYFLSDLLTVSSLAVV